MHYKTCSLLLVLLVSCLSIQSQNHSLRFFGGGVAAPDADRVKIRIDDPTSSSDVGPPVDVGATDFTIEFWLRGEAADNTSDAISCGFNYDWIYGNIILDRDRFNQGRGFGISIAGNRPVFGVINDAINSATICGTTNVLDGNWHHIVCQRRISDGWLWLFVDGILEAQEDGPDLDISYPDDGVPGNFCNGPCDFSDPFVVLGAEKHDAGASFPSFNGFMDELRFSTVLRYTNNFTVPTSPFQPDATTAALYHFDEGTGTVLGDASGAAGGPSDGVLNVGGNPNGPVWSMENPFDEALSIDVFDLAAHVKQVQVYPQVFSEMLHISLPEPGDVLAGLFALSGKKVWEGQLQGGKRNSIQGFSELPAGLYFFRVPNAPVQKLIKY